MDMSIKELEQEIIDEFSIFENWMEKYEYIIELGKDLPIIEEKYKKHYDVSKIILNDFIVKLCKRANNYSL